jgi:hypothetical protein
MQSSGVDRMCLIYEIRVWKYVKVILLRVSASNYMDLSRKCVEIIKLD